MASLLERLEKTRDWTAPILILGETGSGKEVVARAIHAGGPRRSGRMLVLHCGSLAGELFESELFGCEPGAFTGAGEGRSGILETLAGGTLLLDEIGSLDAAMQAKLLRALESGSARRVGGTTPFRIDVQFLASTNADPRALAAAGKLRTDLYYRLARLEIAVPPLRRRVEDIPELARHFLLVHAGHLGQKPRELKPEALAALCSHSWPGNVRELETAMVRIQMEASAGAGVSGEEVREVLSQMRQGSLFSRELVQGRRLQDLRDELDRVYLLNLFEEMGGSIPRMVAALDVTQASLYRWLRRLGIDVRGLRRELLTRKAPGP